MNSTDRDKLTASDIRGIEDRPDDQSPEQKGLARFDRCVQASEHARNALRRAISRSPSR